MTGNTPKLTKLGQKWPEKSFINNAFVSLQ